MWLRLLGLVALFYPLLSPGAQLHATDFCSCLTSGMHDSTGKRTGGLGVSLIVPANAHKSVEDYSEGQGLRWSTPKFSIDYSHVTKRSYAPISFDKPDENECVIEVNQKRVNIRADDLQGKTSIFAVFEGKPGDAYLSGISIIGSDKDTVCSLGASTIWSAIFDVDHFENLKLLSISPDRKSFLYKNETGAISLTLGM